MISAALAARATAAVAPWMPIAAARFPPLRRTITASPTGMMLVAAMKAPTKCGARFADRTAEYSQPVQYSHFDSKDAIVHAVAIEGFAERAVQLH